MKLYNVVIENHNEIQEYQVISNNIQEVCNLLLERFKNICIEDIQSISLKENNFTINQLCLYQ